MLQSAQTEKQEKLQTSTAKPKTKNKNKTKNKKQKQKTKTKMNKSYVIIISGGSGSGKTTFAKALLNNLGAKNIQILHQDNYYIDQSNKFDGDGGSVNFDHPESLDFKLMQEQICFLKNYKSVKTPIYDFSTHSRKKITQIFNPKPILIVDGTLAMAQKEIREISDLMIFVNCKKELRFSRRLKRDVTERGRTKDGVKAQFTNQVAPMHDKFVEPSKTFATTIVDVDNFDKKIKEVVLHLQNIIKT
ncbi:MAG: uridine kinase [Bdellovibrionales bacterium]|nr:uridine kinase [Bdellovibrionales bacterium]